MASHMGGGKLAARARSRAPLSFGELAARRRLLPVCTAILFGRTAAPPRPLAFTGSRIATPGLLPPRCALFMLEGSTPTLGLGCNGLQDAESSFGEPKARSSAGSTAAVVASDTFAFALAVGSDPSGELEGFGWMRGGAAALLDAGGAVAPSHAVDAGKASAGARRELGREMARGTDVEPPPGSVEVSDGLAGRLPHSKAARDSAREESAFEPVPILSSSCTSTEARECRGLEAR